MTPEQTKKYEEAAKEYASRPTLYTDTQKMKTDFFLAGAAHGHNNAIDKAIAVLNSDWNGKDLYDEIQKLKL